LLVKILLISTPKVKKCPLLRHLLSWNFNFANNNFSNGRIRIAI